MDFIERWLNISPDGGNGASELLIVIAIVVTVISVVGVALRRNFPVNFKEYLNQLGKRDRRDRFDQ